MKRQLILRLHADMVVDNFAGGGGASTGIEWALGRSPDIAVNHDPEALRMHEANHPQTRHMCESVWKIDPKKVTEGRPVALAWFSPDCTFHSKARGGKPFRDRDAAKRRRGLAWIVTRWARAVKPRVIVCENVEELRQWGPLLDDGTPCPLRRGFTFRRWVAQLENCGYVVEMRELRACDYGAPTSRKRLFIIARSDGHPIVWPAASHGPKLAKRYRTAADCIDWSIPCHSIFMSPEEAKKLGIRRPLADKTLARIARGIMRFVINSGSPFIVPVTHGADGPTRIHSIGEPFRTITGANRGELALVAPTLIQTSYGEREGQAPRVLDLHAPLGTIVAGGIKHSVVAAFLAKHFGGHEGTGVPVTKPFATVTTVDHHALVTSNLVKLRGTCRDGQAVTDPMPTLTASGTHVAEVRAFLVKFYGTATGQALDEPAHTVTTKDRFGLVTVAGEQYQIVDIGMRMMSPRELFNAQGFPRDYVIDGLTKTEQIAKCGNAVVPQIAEALVRANCASMAARKRVAA